MNQLALPIALWGSPPPHSVTSILITLNRSVLVTGSNSGQICVWSIETDKVLYHLNIIHSYFNFNNINIFFLSLPKKEDLHR